MSDTPFEPEHNLHDPLIGGRMIRLAGDVYKIDPVDGPEAFPPWCARYRKLLREFRVHLGEPGAGVAPIEFDIIREIILQCRQNLAGFGLDTPDEYGFGNMTTAEAEVFRVWCISVPRAVVLRVIERAEEYLSWASGQVLRRVEQKQKTPPRPAPPPPSVLPGDADPVGMRARITAYLTRLPHLAEGQGRDDVAFGFACFLVRDLRLPDEVALNWLNLWDSGNRPPKGEDRLREIIAHAHAHGQREYGCGLDRLAPVRRHHDPHRVVRYVVEVGREG